MQAGRADAAKTKTQLRHSKANVAKVETQLKQWSEFRDAFRSLAY
jgi:hypothetical protein